MRLFQRKEKTAPEEDAEGNASASSETAVSGPSEPVSFRDAVQKTLGIPVRTDASLVKPLELAYIGDTVYEVMNRLIAVSGPGRAMAEIHKACTERAKAETQARIAEALQGDLTEEEIKIYLRARNAHVGTRTRSAGVLDYHKATGLEAVFGYLYLQGRYERIAVLLREGAGKAGVSLR